MGAQRRRIAAGCLAALLLTAQTAVCTAALPERMESAVSGYTCADGYWVELLGPLREDSAARFCGKLETLREGALSDAAAFYWAIAPDKGVYTDPATTDYAAAYTYLEEHLEGMQGMDNGKIIWRKDYGRKTHHIFLSKRTNREESKGACGNHWSRNPANRTRAAVYISGSELDGQEKQKLT